MKRNLLAIAIPALLLAGAANAAEVVNKDGTKLDVYGQVAAKDYVHGDDVDSHGKSEARLGVWGETEVLDGVKAYARFEWQTRTFDEGTTSKSSDIIDNRYAYTGLDFGSVGMLDYGKNQGVLNAVASYTDILPGFGGEAGDLLVLGSRTASVLTYTNTDLFGAVEGLDFAIQYADNASNKIGYDNLFTGKTGANNQAFGLSAQYSILDTGVQIGGAYSQTADTKGEPGLNSYVVGANYNANNVYFGVIYNSTQATDSKKSKSVISGYEVALAYGIDFEVGRLTPSVAYIQHQTNNETTKADYIKYADLGAQYDFNDNVGAYFDYKFNLIKNEKDQAVIGMTYKF